MSNEYEAARAEAELQWPNGSNPWHTTRRHGFERGAAWQRSQPAGVTDIDRDELAVFLRGTAGYNLATVLSPGEARFLVDEILDYINGKNAK